MDKAIIQKDGNGAPLAGQTFTLEEIEELDFTGITPLAVLGWPIRHSVSPQMHNAALMQMAKEEARFSQWRYYRVEVEPEKLETALTLLLKKGFTGLNLTIPHKVLALEFASTSPDDWSGNTSGAINTLFRSKDGWEGTNTDGMGLMMGLMEAPTYCSVTGRDIVLLGAGGAARSIAATCLVGGCKSLHVGNRSKSRLEEFMVQLQQADMQKVMSGFDIREAAKTQLPKSAIVINATSLGLKSDDPSPVDLSIFDSGTIVFDTTYGRHKSSLLQQAESLGFPCSNGLPMLVNQGARALAIWTGQEKQGLPPEAVASMYAAARKELKLSD